MIKLVFVPKFTFQKFSVVTAYVSNASLQANLHDVGHCHLAMFKCFTQLNFDLFNLSHQMASGVDCNLLSFFC